MAITMPPSLISAGRSPREATIRASTIGAMVPMRVSHRYKWCRREDIQAEKADQLSPQDPGVLELIAMPLLRLGKPTEALTEINLAEDLEGPAPYEQQLASSDRLCHQHSRDMGRVVKFLAAAVVNCR